MDLIKEPQTSKPPTDLRLRDTSTSEKLFPEFYYSSIEIGWYCKSSLLQAVKKLSTNCLIKCFSTNVSSSRPFVTSAQGSVITNLGVPLHHLECFKNKQACDELAKVRTDVWRLLQETTNVNSSEKTGLKRLLKHQIPLACWCGNHKVVLCFKHLLPEFKPVHCRCNVTGIFVPFQ